MISGCCCSDSTRYTVLFWMEKKRGRTIRTQLQSGQRSEVWELLSRKVDRKMRLLSVTVSRETVTDRYSCPMAVACRAGPARRIFVGDVNAQPTHSSLGMAILMIRVPVIFDVVVVPTLRQGLTIHGVYAHLAVSNSLE